MFKFGNENYKKASLCDSDFAFISIIAVKIMSFKGITLVSKIFNPNTPFYFNYGPIYIASAIIISIVLASLKIYSVKKALLVIGINLIAFIMMFVLIISKM